MFLILGSHLQLNEDVAITSIIDGCLHGLIESDSNCSEVNILWLNLDDAITSFAKNLQSILLDELRLLGQFLILSCIILV